jgi:thiamine kinase-like enzyme
MSESKLELEKAAKLPCWKGTVTPEPLSGGITNTNFIVSDGGYRFVVRIGEDIPVHGVMRFNEQAASQAAFEAGVSPEVVYAEPGALVLRFIDGQTLTPEDIRQDDMLARIIPLILRVHRTIPRYFKGPSLVFWVFHVLRDYAQTLRHEGSRMATELNALMETSETLEKAVGAIDLIYGHNDLLAANFIDDGERLWLVDWDYAGYNSALFDLGGLASNNGLSSEQERWLLTAYFGSERDKSSYLRYEAMKCASLLREAMWSMVQEIHSTLDFDFVGYTDENMTRFRSALEQFKTNGDLDG